MEKRTTTTAKRVPRIEDLRSAILAVTRKHRVRNVRVFGSFARNEQRKTSDVDLLVQFPPRFTLIDWSGLKIDLEAAIGRKVDIVSERSIKPALRTYILADARPL